MLGGQLGQHRGREEQVDEVGVELSAPLAGDFHRRRFGAAGSTIVTAVGNDVEGIGDRNDSRRKRDLLAAEPAGIAPAVPALVMGEHPDRKLGIEWSERLEHLRAAARMRGDRAALGRREASVVVDDIEQRLVDLSDVVEERDALDAAEDMVVETGGIAEDQRVSRHPSNMLSRFVVVGLDGVEDRLQRGSGKPLRGRAPATLDTPKGAKDQAGKEGSRSHPALYGKKRGRPSRRYTITA
jgi:hypothetical protein